MSIYVFLATLIAVAALAPFFGVDSRFQHEPRVTKGGRR